MNTDRRSTGIPGLDTILHGGLPVENSTLIRGPPGAGKTTFGLHFLAAGVDAGETCLYVNLGEPPEYARDLAAVFGLPVESIEFANLAPGKQALATDAPYSIFAPDEVEQPAFMSSLIETIEAVDPDRVLLDPFTGFRYLTSNVHQYRTQLLGLLALLRENDVTVLLTSQASDATPDDDLQYMTDAVITLENHATHRTVEVTKLRGSAFQAGKHTFDVLGDRVEVWPSITVPKPSPDAGDLENLSTGVPALDDLVGGGLTQGTVTIVSGPTGAGKTTTGMQVLSAVADAGKRTVMYQFEESTRTLLHRARALGIPFDDLLEQEILTIVEIQPDAFTSGQFGAMVREDVETDGVDFVMIDSIQGLIGGLRGDPKTASDELVRLGRYLRERNVGAIFVNEVHHITGSFQVSEEKTSHLADTIVFIRHVEYRGEMRKAIGTLKKRTGDFEHALRELTFTSDGVQVGEPLSHLRGILTGTPDWGIEEPRT